MDANQTPQDSHSLARRSSHFIHRYFLWLLLASYVLAAIFPQPGLWIRATSAGEIHLAGQSTKVTLPTLMLACLLLNAGLGVQTAELGRLLRNKGLLAAGLATNLLVPIGFILLINLLMSVWHNPDEVQNILVGLALVASMPIAGSSTAWTQNASGNLALSLALVLFSTLLSPLLTPMALHIVGWMATGDYAEDLHELAAQGTNIYLGLWVILPTLLGIGLRTLVGNERMTRIKPLLHLTNFANLWALNYSNASVSLPEAIHHPDADFLAVVLGISATLCASAFFGGWLLSRLFHTDRADRASLMFGLGMNNNGTGLVLASLALADHPRVMLPIIFYNLVQHLIAGTVDRWMFRRPAEAH